MPTEASISRERLPGEGNILVRRSAGRGAMEQDELTKSAVFQITTFADQTLLKMKKKEKI